jgi:hypothetical protein
MNFILLLFFYLFYNRIILYADDFTYLYNYIEDDMHTTKDSENGHLTGDVQNWGSIIQNYILQVFEIVFK